MSRSLTLIVVPAFVLSLTACDTGSSSDGSRYQQWAETVSTIPLDPASAQADNAPNQISLEPSSREPSSRALRVELMTPHQLWDARNGPLKVPTMEVLENISPTEIVRTAETAPSPARETRLPETVMASTAETSTAPTKLIQLGAYSSEQAARQAWQRVQSSVGTSQAGGLHPRFETVEVSGRQLVRLRVATTDDQARSLCQALASNDPWCKSPS